MAQLSKRIQVPGTDAVRVRRDGEKVELVLIDQAGGVQVVPVAMEEEKARVAA